jgi:DNA-binding transcriptional regulator YiaG
MMIADRPNGAETMGSIRIAPRRPHGSPSADGRTDGVRDLQASEALEMKSPAKASVAEAVKSICETLELSPGDLATALGTTRQSVYRWQEGGPAEGPSKLILFGLSERLRKADGGALEAWRRKVKDALQERRSSLDTLEALVVPPGHEQTIREVKRAFERAQKFAQKLSRAFEAAESVEDASAQRERRHSVAPRGTRRRPKRV